MIVFMFAMVVHNQEYMFWYSPPRCRSRTGSPHKGPVTRCLLPLNQHPPHERGTKGRRVKSRYAFISQKTKEA